MTKIILILSLIVGLINCAVLISHHKFHSGKIHIFSDKDGMHCGSLMCPGRSRCVITQKTLANNTMNLITKEKCFDDDDNLLKNTKTTEKLEKSLGVISKRYEVNSDGVQIIDPEKVKEIAKNLAKTFDDMQKNVAKALDFGDEWPFGKKNNPFGKGFPFNNPVENPPVF